MSKDHIMNQKGINNWILDKGSSVARLTRREINEPIAYVGEEPLAFDEFRKKNEIVPVIFWNNIWTKSKISQLLDVYIQFES